MKKIVALTVVFLVVSGSLMAFSPGFRTMVWDRINDWTCWTPEAIQKDPLGYMKFVEKKLTKDRNSIQATWRNLGVSVGKLAKMRSEKHELLTRGMEFAEEFREAYHNANGEFPVVVRGESYTEAQLRSQLSLVLAQTDGLTQSLSEIDVAMNDANGKMEDLTVQKEKTESQLALLDTKHELFQAEKLSTEGLQLIASVNELFKENTQAIAGNPVRTIGQILQAEQRASTPANSVRVEEFLNARKINKPSGATIEVIQIVAEMVDEEVVSVEIPQKEKVRSKNRPKQTQSQPIYQQSQPIYQQSI